MTTRAVSDLFKIHRAGNEVCIYLRGERRSAPIARYREGTHRAFILAAAASVVSAYSTARGTPLDSGDPAFKNAARRLPEIENITDSLARRVFPPSDVLETAVRALAEYLHLADAVAGWDAAYAAARDTECSAIKATIAMRSWGKERDM